MNGTEPALLHSAIEGDRTAFTRLVELHWSRLVRLARSVVGESDAEDAVQDGLVTAWLKLDTLRQLQAFDAWLTRVVLRSCLRRTRRFRPMVPIEEAPVPSVTHDPAARIDIERVLGLLAPQQRAVMHLTVVEGMSDGEIGDALEITAAAVRATRNASTAPIVAPVRL